MDDTPMILQPMPAVWRVSRCAAPACAAPIYWALTETGKAMPVDITPSRAGTMILRDRGDERPLAVAVPKTERANRGDLHTSHFATCKRVQVFRRR